MPIASLSPVLWWSDNQAMYKPVGSDSASAGHTPTPPTASLPSLHAHNTNSNTVVD